MRRALLFLFFWMCASALAFAQLPEPQLIPVAPDSGGRVIAQVYVNEDGPFPFIVDTGANRSAISTRLAALLRLTPHGEGEVHTLTGMIVAPLVRVDRVLSGAVDLRGATLPMIAPDVLGGAMGILGVESLTDRRLLFDFAEGHIAIGDPDDPMPAGDWTTIQGRLRFGNLVVTRARIGRVNAHVIIDTGATQTIVNMAFRDRHRIAVARIEGSGLRAIGVSGRSVAARELLLPRVVMGSVTVLNLAVGVADVHAFDFWGLSDEPALLVGMDVLGRAEAFMIDYRRATVHFRALE